MNSSEMMVTSIVVLEIPSRPTGLAVRTLPDSNGIGIGEAVNVGLCKLRMMDDSRIGADGDGIAVGGVVDDGLSGLKIRDDCFVGADADVVLLE